MRGRAHVQRSTDTVAGGDHIRIDPLGRARGASQHEARNSSCAEPVRETAAQRWRDETRAGLHRGCQRAQRHQECHNTARDVVVRGFGGTLAHEVGQKHTCTRSAATEGDGRRAQKKVGAKPGATTSVQSAGCGIRAGARTGWEGLLGLCHAPSVPSLHAAVSWLRVRSDIYVTTPCCIAIHMRNPVVFHI